MKYEMKRIEDDPFDLMCSDCEVNYIEYWEAVSEKELKDIHAECLVSDMWIPDYLKENYTKDFGWEPTEEDFNEWLEHSIRDGYIRRVA